MQRANTADARVPLPPRILVVDDNALVRLLVTQALSEQGADVVTAPDGPRALDLLDAEHFDLVVVDFVMPGMLGDEVIRRIHGHPRAEVHRLPILGLSGSVLDAEAVFGDAGADATISKPLKDRELIAAVTRLLTGPRHSARAGGEPAGQGAIGS